MLDGKEDAAHGYQAGACALHGESQAIPPGVEWAAVGSPRVGPLAAQNKASEDDKRPKPDKPNACRSEAHSYLNMLTSDRESYVPQ